MPDRRAATINTPQRCLARQSRTDNHADAATLDSYPDCRRPPIQIAALHPCRYATKIIVASRCPYRPRSRAAFRSSSTSLGVRYSRGRRAALICRRGGTVPFSMFGSGRRRIGFVLEMRKLGSMTVPFMTILGTVGVYHTQGARLREPRVSCAALYTAASGRDT
jgi:hypothetical protein